jgi:hypothetical protein
VGWWGLVLLRFKVLFTYDENVYVFEIVCRKIHILSEMRVSGTVYICHFPLDAVCWGVSLTLILLTSTKWWAFASASKWQMGFNSAFKGLISSGLRYLYGCYQIQHRKNIIKKRVIEWTRTYETQLHFRQIRIFDVKYPASPLAKDKAFRGVLQQFSFVRHWLAGRLSLYPWLSNSRVSNAADGPGCGC